MSDNAVIFEEAIQANWNRLNSKFARQFALTTSNAAFLHEMATVRINLGRAMGHTTYIQNNALAGDLIVVMRQDMTKEFHRGRILTLRQIRDYSGVRGHRFDRIWVDAASMVFQNKTAESDFYNEVAGCNPKQIIMLG